MPTRNRQRLPRIAAPIAAALAILLAAHITPPARAQDPAVATAKGDIIIQLPKGWPTTKPADGNVVAKAPQIDRDETGEFQASIFVSQGAGDKIDGAAQQAWAKANIKGYIPTELPKPITINGVPGVLFGGTIKSGPGPLALRSRQYMFTKNNQIYVITFTSLSTKFEAYAPIVEAAVGSLKMSK